MRESNRIPQWIWLASFLAYVMAAALGLALAFPGTNASPFWPPTALALALLYRHGLRMWPVILAGAFTSNLLFMLLAGVAPLFAVPASIGIGAGNMLEAWLGVYLIRRIAGKQFPFDGLRGLFAFFLAASLAPIVSATIGVTSSRMVSMSGVASYSQNWLTWWVGDVSGALTMGPILMLLLPMQWRIPMRLRLLEASALCLTLVLGTMIAFGAWQEHSEHGYPLVFLLLPMILWAALRFQAAGAASAVFLISSTAVIGALGGGGPFARGDVNESLFLLQVFIIVLAGTTLSLGAVLTERSRLASKLAKSNAELNALAFNDALTGLPNRRALLDRIEQAARQARRRDKHAAVLFLDLDRFKRINDSLGHEVGDELLKTIAQRLRGALRDEDSVCRLGGDEFVLLLCDIDTFTNAAIVAQKVIETIHAPMRLANHDLAITTSIGIALIPDDGNDGNNLLRCADLAMYRAKERGRNNFQFHSEEMNWTAVARMEREDELRHASVAGEFCLYYQPIVDLHDTRVIGIEAMLRWQHPEFGLLLPHDFIPLAEESGLIVDIGGWALQEACYEISQLQEAGQQTLRLSVNLSMRQLHDRNLPELITRTLGQYPLDALWLNIEVTERLMREDLLAELEFLHQLDHVGVSLAVDSFDSAGASLNLIERLPVAAIKIDHKLIDHLLDDQEARDMTMSMIATARQRGIPVVAEGIETQEQRDFLIASGCDYAQGFWFHSPLTLPEVTKLLMQQLVAS